MKNRNILLAAMMGTRMTRIGRMTTDQCCLRSIHVILTSDEVSKYFIDCYDGNADDADVADDYE